jgi:hypothetical protein
MLAFWPNPCEHREALWTLMSQVYHSAPKENFKIKEFCGLCAILPARFIDYPSNKLETAQGGASSDDLR